MIPQTEYAWAAGWLEADGSFSLTVFEKRGYLEVRPHIRSSQAFYKEPLERLVLLLSRPVRIMKTKGHIYEVFIGGTDRVIDLLQKVLPYMGHKKARAEDVLAACEIMLERKSRYTEKQKKELRHLSKRVCKANRNEEET